MRILLLAIISAALLGMDFWNPPIKGYRIWIGPNESTDWIDVCCKSTSDGQLLWADYTPIEEISITRFTGRKVRISLKKAYSLWELSMEEGNPPSAVLQFVRPTERVMQES